MGMARKCCVRNCESDGKEVRFKGLPLHKFPKDPLLRNKWLGNGLFDPQFKPTTGQFVCHRHFKRADYEIIKGHKFVLRKGSIPTIFEDYDNHPDPLTMPVKSSTSYPQEDLDLINSEILNMDNAGSGESSIFAEARTPKSDSCGEACSSRPGSSADSLNPSELTDATDAGFKSTGENEDAPRSVENALDGTEHKPDAGKNDVSVTKTQTKTSVAKEDPKIIKEESEAAKTAEDKGNTNNDESKAKTMVNRGSLNFNPGDRIEAKDFSDKWYSARVVETDWAEREVLIHFDKSSSRFDEWIPMDSSRLRVLQMQPRETKLRQRDDFDVGERILATWADGRKYPAKVNAVLGNDRYDVLFDDGYAKIVRSSKMTKIASSIEKKAMEPDSYIGSKQERRDKKRKHTVMELFQTHPRKRNKPETTAVKKDVPTAPEDANNCSLDSSVDLDSSAAGTFYDSGAEMLRGFENPKPKVKSYTKKVKRDAVKNDTDLEDDVGPEWVDGEPQGVEGFIVDTNEITGTRRSIIVADRRLPPIWQKHFTQRRAGTSAGKWDVLFVHQPSGKKFRSRSDIKAFTESQGCEFDSDMFDFCIHRRKSKSSIARVKQETHGDGTKKIKTLLPKTKVTPAMPDNSTPLISTPTDSLVSMTPTTATPAEDGAVFIGSLRVEMEDSLFKCPKEGCCKNFRKENLLQMHIKHYHPEYSKFLGSTPNVADLAYARTIGESVIDVTPKKSSNSFLDKINKFEKRKAAAQEKQILPGIQMVPSPGQPVPLVATSPLPAINSASEIVGPDKISGIMNRDSNDSKFELMSPMSSASLDVDDEMTKKIEANCAMSPGALFDLKIREEKTQIGIKTLLPVRPPATLTDTSKLERSNPLDEVIHNDKTKGSRKRQLSEFNSESSKPKGRPSMQELTDDYGDLDDSALDAEGPAGLVYRFSRRKSDAKSDENSQSSQLNDSRLEKADNPKGDASKTDISIEAEDGEGVMMMINGEMVKVEQLRREEIINCTCGFMEEDGLMIQCDLCLCWQHGHCNAIEREKDVPEKYICYICRHPYRQRPSMKYMHDQEWLKDGKLPSIGKRTKDQAAINRRTAMLKRSFDLVAALMQIQQLLHSIRVKISVAQKKDHPKLYLWAKNWEKSEVKEPIIEPVPVMRIVKKKVDTQDSGVEKFVEPKIEIPAIAKEDFDEKSIASDTELMKILEEDSTHSEETTKVECKKEETKNSNGELDAALEKNKTPGETENGVAATDIKKEETSESKNESPTQRSSSTNLETVESPLPINPTIAEPKQEPPAPLQPFVPEPEAPIDPDECRQRLLEHIEHFQTHIDSQLTTVEAQVAVLESMDPDCAIPSADADRRIKQTMLMLHRDLQTVRKLAALC